MKGKKYNIIKNNRFRRTTLFVSIFIIIYVLLLIATTPQRYMFKVGDIPRVDIKAPKDTVDENATKEKEDQAADKVGRQYTQKTEIKKESEDVIKSLFENMTITNSSETLNETQKIDKLKEISEIQLSTNQYKTLLSIPKDDLSALNDKIIKVVDKAYEKNISEEDEGDITAAKERASSSLDELGLNSDLNNVFKSIIERLIKPNFFYDEEKTNEMVKEAQKSITKVIIKQNQIIVKEGVPVTQDQLDILSNLGMLDDENRANYFDVYISLGGFLAVILFLQYNYIYRNYKDIFYNTKRLTLISVINIISIILAKLIGTVSASLIPFAFAPMLLTLLINYKISIVASVLNVVIIGALNGFDTQIIIIGIVSSILGATLLKKMQQRNEMLYSTVYIAIVIAILNLCTGILMSSNFGDVLLKSSLTIGGGLLSGIFALGILPFLEGTFNEVTTLKLLELSNANSPLLKKLLMEAPGTYHHSMLVANLAEMAAEEVGANSVVVRVGAYYHDIGKTERPYFFGENQMSGQNPHNHIKANLSANIIISHVKDGIELAKKYNIPNVIQDIIAEHHGTTIVKYFYYTMKNNSENPDEIDVNDYTYPGPIPSSKESGIVMLADGVEAAVRSIKEPTEEKISEMVNNIIDDKLTSGQLNNCDLTINDIGKIKKCFLKALKGIYHHRIEYPKEKIKEINNDKKNTEE